MHSRAEAFEKEAEMLLWTVLALGAAAYCLVRAIQDFRDRKYVWAVVGVLAAAGLLLTPIQTHAVNFDFPPPASSR
jgi:hypothetical protein